jgi:hypothetical protein
MTGTTKEDVDPEKMMNAELHAHFTQMLVGSAHDVDTRLGNVDPKLSDAMEQIDGLKESFQRQARGHSWLPPQPGVHVPRLPP